MFAHAFPIVIVDEDFEGTHAAGRAVRRLAQELEQTGRRVMSGFGYADARRLARVYHNASCLLVSIDGAEQLGGQWEALEDLFTAALQRCPHLPIFLLGDERTAEVVPAAVLKHTLGFFRLHEDSPEFLARNIARAAEVYLDRLLPPLFKALANYTHHASYSWHTPGHGGGVAFRKSPIGRAFYEFYGENALRSDVSVSVRELGSLLDHTGPIAEGERNAARIFGSDHTLFVVNGTTTANKIVWHACVGRGDLVLCDRNSHQSILHALVMTGAVPIYLQAPRNRYGLAGPIPRDQFTAASIHARVVARGVPPGTTGTVRLLALANSTYDGICYNVDGLKRALDNAVDVLHFDEAWFAYANFHEFYAGHHAISSTAPCRSAHALTCVTHSTHKMLAAFSQASMLHLLNSESSRTDIERFKQSFLMHVSTSPQYGILASCDVAAAMMAPPAGRSIVGETLEEAFAFRRAMSAMRKQTRSRWWFEIWQPPGMAERPVADQAAWTLMEDEPWHGFGPVAPHHALLDPTKVTLLTPGLRADGRTAAHGVPAAIVTAFLSSRRIEVEKTGLYSFLVLFSMGVTKGKWSTLVTELLNFRDLYDANAPVKEVLPDLVEAYPEAYGGLGLRHLCDRMHHTYTRSGAARAQEEMYATLPEMALSPADAFDATVRGRTESVEIDHLMGRTVGVVLLPRSGSPLVMPGERITQASAAIHRYLLSSREFDAAFPGFESQIRGLRTEPGANGRPRYLVDCIRE